jgi:Flp pilus assembly protein CpaB
MTYRVRNLVVAIGLALVAMMLTLFYVTNYKRSVQRGESNVQVYVAAHDVASGVSGAELVKHHDIKVVEVAKRTVVAGAISSPDQIEKLVLSQPLYAGDQVTLRRFADVAAQGIRAQLRGTMRAVQVPGDSNQLLAGTLRAGDHVDVVASMKISNLVADHDIPATRIVLRDLTVLSAPNEPASAKVTPNGDASAILAVTDTQVQKLYFVMKNADWTLQLRPVVDAADSSERLESTDSILTDGISGPQWAHFVSGNERNLR